MRVFWWCFIGILAGLSSAAAREPAKTRAELLLGSQSAAPGSSVVVGLKLTMAPGWHTYWRNPGESGTATTIQWTLPDGIQAGALEGPPPEKLVISDLVTLAYHDSVVLLTSLTLAPTLAHSTYPLRGKVQWLECSDKLCVPQSQEVQAELVVSGQSVSSANAEALKAARARLPVGSPDLQASSSWHAEAQGETRLLNVEWAVPPQVTEVDFYPYEAKTFGVRFTNEWSEIKAGRVSLRRAVDKLEGEWPTEIAGLVVFGGADPASRRYHAVSFQPRGRPSVAVGVSVVSPPSAPTASAPPQLLKMLLFALIGGMILNIMPCVLPVISLKILGFVNQSRTAPQRVRQLGLFYAAGVLVSFLILAGMIIGLKQAGKAASWGIQFGNPQFLIVLTTLITLVALNLFGVFEITLGEAAGKADELARQEGGAGAFFNGMLAVVLATPCTAPFLAVAIGFALAQPSGIIVLFFATVALGLALPYVLLSWNSSWLKLLPRPGAWMERFKVGMGFPMLGTAIWLYSLTGKLVGPDRGLWFGLFLVIVATAAWVFGQFIQRSSGSKGIAWAAWLVLLGIGYGWALEKEVDWRAPAQTNAADPTGTVVAGHGAIPWKRWSAAAVEEARAQGRPILVDFTADWCVTCNVNRRTSIEIPAVIEKLKEINAVALLGDYTTTPDDITEELARWQRAGVPLVLVYPADAQQPAQVLPEILTPSIMLEALSRAAKR